MLKNKGARQLVIFFTSILFVIGVLLIGIGFAMNDDLSFLKEEGNHRWYQMIRIDENDNFHLGFQFDDKTIIGIF
ncbi:MAG: hypothetical protein RR512_03975 [Coprobacillus sp.]